MVSIDDEPGPRLMLHPQKVTIRSFINRFCNDTSGATAIEYGVIAALIAVVIITATKVLGMSVFHKLREVLMAIRGF